MDATIGIDLLPRLDEQDRQRIADRSNALVESLKTWAQLHPTMRPVRIPMVAMTAATALPRADVEAAQVWAQVIMWMFAIDDLSDPDTFGPDHMRQKADQWYWVIRGSRGEVHDGDLDVVVAETAQYLSHMPLFRYLGEHCARRWRRHIRGVAQEYQDSIESRSRGVAAFPLLDDYRRNGIHTIGFPVLGSMAMILHNDPSVLTQIDTINASIDHASAALRFYNDVATLDKEIAAQEINPVLIVREHLRGEMPGASQEHLLEEAKLHILELGDQHARTCFDLLADHVDTETKQWEETCYRLVALHAGFYGRSEQDFHTTSLARVHSMLARASVS